MNTRKDPDQPALSKMGDLPAGANRQWELIDTQLGNVVVYLFSRKDYAFP